MLGWFAFDRWHLARDWAYVSNVIVGNLSVARWHGDVVVLADVTSPERLDWVRFWVGQYQEILAEFGIMLTVRQLVPGQGPQPMESNTVTIVTTSKEDYVTFMESLNLERNYEESTGTTMWLNNKLGGQAVMLAIFRNTVDPHEEVIVHEMAHAIGLTGGHTVRSTSVVHEASNATRLAPIDRKAIRFLYGFLWYGAGPEEVRAAFDAHWRHIRDD